MGLRGLAILCRLTPCTYARTVQRLSRSTTLLAHPHAHGGGAPYLPLRRLHHRPAVVPLLTAVAQRWHSTAGGEVDLDAYESMMMTMDAAAEEEQEEAAGLQEVVTQEDMVAHIVSLLPPSGDLVRLTDLAHLVDLEQFHEQYHMSLKDLLLLTPSLFRCQERVDGLQRRWYVRRATPTTTTTTTTSSTTTVAKEDSTLEKLDELFAEEELRQVLPRPAAPVPHMPAAATRRPSLQRVPSIKVDASVWPHLAAALPPEPVPVQAASAYLPLPLAEQVHSAHVGLTRLLKENTAAAAPWVQLSRDGTLLARTGHLPAGTAPYVEVEDSASTTMLRDAGFAADWDVDLDLDGEEGEGAASDAEAPPPSAAGEEPLEKDDTFLSSALSNEPVPYSADEARPSPSDHAASWLPPPPPPPRRAVPPAPTASPAAAAAAPSPLERKPAASPAVPKAKKKKGPRSPEEWLAAHAQLAADKGWRSPHELLDLFVECVPTFPVAVHDLVPSDQLARVLGPQGTLRRAIKVYFYFFEVDKTQDTVRLTAAHPLAGSANHYYAEEKAGAREKARTLQRLPTSHTFATAKPLINSHLTLETKRKANMSPNHTSGAVKGVPSALCNKQADVFSSAAPEDRLLVQLLATTSVRTFVPVAHIAAQCHATVAEVQRSLARRSHPHLFLTRTADNGERQLRLRPYWLAPCSLGEAPPEQLPVELRQRVRPLWTPLSSLLAKLPPAVAEQLRLTAEAAHPSSGPDRDPDTALSLYLREYGSLLWVEGGRVRRYMADAELDEVTHVCLEALRHGASAEKWTPLHDLVEQTCRLVPGTGGLSDMLRHPHPQWPLEELLLRHNKVLETKQVDHILLVKRRTAFGSFK